MKNLLFILLLLPSVSFAQEAWIDDVDVVDPPAFVDPLESRIESLESKFDDVAEGLKELAKAIGQLVNAPKAVAMPSQCQCDCDCPTIDEIRVVMREEIERVTVTVKSVTGEEKTVDMPVSQPLATKPMELQPGDVVVAIDGQPVTPFRYSRGVGYTAPGYELRTLSTGGGLMGAVRQSTCRMVNGVKVCN